MISETDIIPIGVNDITKSSCSRKLYVLYNLKGDYTKLKNLLLLNHFKPRLGDRVISIGNLFGKNAENNKRLLSLVKQNWFKATIGHDECWLGAGFDAYLYNDVELSEQFEQKYGTWLADSYKSLEIEFCTFFNKASMRHEVNYLDSTFGFSFGPPSFAEWKSNSMLSAVKKSHDLLFNIKSRQVVSIKSTGNIDALFCTGDVRSEQRSFNNVVIPQASNEPHFSLVV